MHFPRMIERWAAPEALVELVKRQRTNTPIINLPITSALQPATTDAPETTKADPTTQNQPTPTPQPTTQQTQQTTNKPSTSTPPATTQQPSTTSKPPSTTAPPTTAAPTTLTKATTPPTTDVPTPSNTVETLPAASSSAAAKSDSASGINSPTGKNVATGVGVVAGVIGGFALILLGVFLWRRHQRRKQMERIGSMEELDRAPSPSPLARSYTRGHGARQPIDDDDDFLTPMDTMPNTVRMDEWNSSKSSPTGSEAMYDDKSVYAESVYQEDLAYDNGQMGDEYPMPPPPAMTASNGRYYSGDFTGMPPQSPSTPSSSSAGGAIPTYSAMNKYAAYSAGAAAPPSNMSSQRPGGGYRAHDSYDAGGYV